MSEDAQDEFSLLRAATAGGQGRAEAALVLAEGALRVPALAVEAAREGLA